MPWSILHTGVDAAPNIVVTPMMRRILPPTSVISGSLYTSPIIGNESAIIPRAIGNVKSIVRRIKAVSGLTVVYEKVFFDAPALDYSDQTLVQRLLYLAQEEDQELFADEQIKAIYAETWERMEEKQTVQA